MYKNDQIRFIPGMQDWVSIRKSNNVIHYITWLKEESLYNHLDTCWKSTQLI